MNKIEKLKREVIKKHLEDKYGKVLKSSVDYYAKDGKVSGGFFTTIKEMLQEFGEKYKNLDKINQL